MSKNQRKTTEQFIEEARNTHGTRYIYDKVSYTNNSTPVQIQCKIHGDFFQIPAGHLNGNNCPKCARKKTDKTRLKITEQFIEEAEEVHKGLYSELLILAIFNCDPNTTKEMK